MNCVILSGNITKDLELKKANDTSVVSFAIGVTGSKEPNFVNIVAFGKVAENTVKYCKKGSKINVKGYLRSRSYEDKDKNKRYVTEVVADSYNGIEFVNTKGNESTIDENLFVD